MRRFIKNFFKCGTVGWCIEILFTALQNLRRREMTLTGNTSLWMFPIYGMAAFLSPIFHLLRKLPCIIRGLFYMCSIFTVEYISGIRLRKKGLCPWDYHRSGWNIKGIIRLDYAPLWFAAGLLFERIVCPPKPHKPLSSHSEQRPSSQRRKRD